MDAASPLPTLQAALSREGLGLARRQLRVDPARAARLAFVSSPRYPRRLLGLHERAVGTPETFAALGAEGPGLLPVAPGRSFELNGLTFQLFPSGHLPGAAQLWIGAPDGDTLCFVGPWSAAPSERAPAGAQVEADTLVFDARWAAPETPAPSRAAALEEALALALEALGRDQALLVVADPLGAGYELIEALLEGGAAVSPHRSQRRRLGKTARGELLPYEGALRPGVATLFPPGLALPPRGPGACAIYLGPEVLTGEAPEGFDHQVAWSDWGDAAELLAYADEVGPERVQVTGRFAAPLVEALRRAGHDATPLSPGDQLGLFPPGA